MRSLWGERIPEGDRNHVKQKFHGKNSKNLKKVQLKCEVFDLNSSELIGSTKSGVIKATQSKEYGSLEMKEVHPKVSCTEGGRKILVVSEHPMKKKSVVPVFQLFDSHGNRVEDRERLLRQPEVSDQDDRMLVFLTPRQDQFHSWSHLTLELKLRRTEAQGESESLSSCTFQYHQHMRYQLPYKDENGGDVLICLDCDHSYLDGDQERLSRDIPDHSGPGRKRRRMSSTVRENSQVSGVAICYQGQIVIFKPFQI